SEISDDQRAFDGQRGSRGGHLHRNAVEPVQRYDAVAGGEVAVVGVDAVAIALASEPVNHDIGCCGENYAGSGVVPDDRVVDEGLRASGLDGDAVSAEYRNARVDAGRRNYRHR